MDDNLRSVMLEIREARDSSFGKTREQYDSWLKRLGRVAVERCLECDERVGENDWIVNWGLCNDCFDSMLEEAEQHKR